MSKPSPPRPPPSMGHIPFFQKLGIATFGLTSCIGLAGFLSTTLTKRSGAFLGLTLAGAVSTVALVQFSVRRRGIVTFLPKQAEAPLFEWTVLDAAREMNSAMDFEKARDLAIELAPLALACGEVEVQRAIENMSGEWQRLFTTKGLIGLLPVNVQLVLLPKGYGPVVPLMNVPRDKKPLLLEQSKLFKELALLRAREIRDDLAERWVIIQGLKMAAELLALMFAQLRANTSSDLQVYGIMSFIFIVVMRLVLRWSFFFIGKIWGSIFFFL